MRFPSWSKNSTRDGSSSRAKWIVLVVAIGFGLLAALTANIYLKRRLAALKETAPIEMVDVVVPKESLPKGARLSSATVAARRIPKQYALSEAITPDQFARAENAQLRFPAAAGEQLVWSQLESAEGASFSAHIAVGRRAVTIPVDEISSVSGMLVPGDVIDIVVGLQKDNRAISLPLLQSVKVLATGSRVSRDEKGDDKGDGSTQGKEYNTVTLDASPSEAQRVLLAREIGKVTALLRHPDDKLKAPLAILDANALTGGHTRRASAEIPVIIGGSSGGMTNPQSINDFRATLNPPPPPPPHPAGNIPSPAAPTRKE